MKTTFAAPLVLALVVAVGSTGAALAAFSDADADGSGAVSWGELNLLVPDMTEADFASADLDANGELSIEEYDAYFVTTGTVGSSAPAIDTPQPLPQTLTWTDPDLD